MKVQLLGLILFSNLFYSFCQSEDECYCDTTFRTIKEGTNQKDSINWKSVECFYSKVSVSKRLRGISNTKSLVYYQEGKRHGTYFEYHPIKYLLVVPKYGYQQKKPHRYNPWKDFIRKSVYGISVHGTYENGLKEGAWVSYDTNQRIIQKRFFHQGREIQKENPCNGTHGNPYLDRGETDSIMRHVKTANDGMYTFLVRKEECSYTVKNRSLNGPMKNFIYRGNKKLLVGTFHFKENCLVDTCLRFSITGDTTRIETNFKFGIPYRITSYTPSSRSETIYRDPLYSYETGLIVMERKKAPRIKKPKK
ncbi:MAG: hypothetical protein MK066_02315 [Crocinitomicaceae bacterium]|nr:hypothetical protein [Crocinitomicaceae bacterium]